MGRIIGGTSALTAKDRAAVLQALKGLEIFQLLGPLLEQAEEADRLLQGYKETSEALTRTIDDRSRDLRTLEAKVATVQADYLKKQADAEAETRRPLEVVRAEVAAQTQTLRDEAESFEQTHNLKIVRWQAEAETARQAHDDRKAELRAAINELKAEVAALTAQRDELLADIEAIRKKVA